MPGLGSFALAGAVGGIGESMIKEARQKREDKLAALKRQQELEDQDTQHNNRMEQIAASKRRTGGRGGGRGRGLGGRGYQLNSRERDDLARAHKGMLEKFFPKGNAPTEAQLGIRVEEIRSQNRNLSLSAAIEQAAGEWGGTDVETTETEERSYLNPRRYIQGPTYEETTTEEVFGFNSAGGEASTPPPATNQAPAQSRAPQAVPPEAEQALSDARDAIARGADRNAVIARLKEMGIDPEGL